MPQIVWTSRPDGYVDYFNERWYEFTGQPRGVGGDESWVAVVHPDDLADTAQVWAAAMVAGDFYETKHRFRRGADGAYRWHLSRAHPIRDPSGRIVRWYGTSTDVHDQKQTEADLRASEGRLADVMRTALDCVIGMDHRGRVTEWNPAAAATFGWTHDEAVGQELAAMVIPPDLRERHRAGLAHFLAGGAGPALNQRLELTAMRRGGEQFPRRADNRPDRGEPAGLHRLRPRHHRPPTRRNGPARERGPLPRPVRKHRPGLLRDRRDVRRRRPGGRLSLHRGQPRF